MRIKSSTHAIVQIAVRAKVASRGLSLLPTSAKNAALHAMAKALTQEKSYLMKENQKDLQAARKQDYPQALIDRLTLNSKRIDEMAQCLRDTAELKDPVGEALNTWKRPNGLVIKKVRVPFGVVGIIYESRPNVTADCIGLCLKSGNAVILKGGKEAAYSNQIIFNLLKESLKESPIPQDAIQLVSSTDRAAVQSLLKMSQYVDLI